MDSKTCSVDGCSGRVIARGWCEKHYNRWKRHGDPLYVAPPKPRRTCTIEGCNKPHVARGWCDNHYKKWELYGDPVGRGTKYAPAGTGTLNSEGYIVHTVNGKQVKEHRAVMERVLGRPLRDDEIIHHKDGDKLNNDPSNLEVTTFAEHTRQHRLTTPRKTHCVHGHLYTPETTYYRKDGRGRMCKTCNRDKMRRRNNSRLTS